VDGKKRTGDLQVSKTNQTNRPSHHLYVVQGDGENAIWTEIGALWRHADGNGFNLDLRALPITGDKVRTVIRARKEKPKAEGQ
jgi:hypothetical protein